MTTNIKSKAIKFLQKARKPKSVLWLKFSFITLFTCALIAIAFSKHNSSSAKIIVTVFFAVISLFLLVLGTRCLSKKKKALSLVAMLSVALMEITTLLLLFLKNNFFSKIPYYACIICFLICLTSFCITLSYLLEDKDNYKKVTKRVLLISLSFIIGIVILLFIAHLAVLTYIKNIVGYMYYPIIAIAIIIAFFAMISSTFAKPAKKMSHTDKMILTFCLYFILVVFICISIYIMNFNEKALKIIVPIFAACIGGAITLSALSAQLKQQSDDKKNDIRLLHVPYIQNIRSPQRNLAGAETLKPLTPCTITYRGDFIIKIFAITNISQYPIMIDSIIVDDLEFPFSSNIIAIQQTALMQERIKSIKEPKSIELVVSDILMNKYKMECSFAIEEDYSLIDLDEEFFMNLIIIKGIKLPTLINK